MPVMGGGLFPGTRWGADAWAVSDAVETGDDGVPDPVRCFD